MRIREDKVETSRLEWLKKAYKDSHPAPPDVDDIMNKLDLNELAAKIVYALDAKYGLLDHDGGPWYRATLAEASQIVVEVLAQYGR